MALGEPGVDRRPLRGTLDLVVARPGARQHVHQRVVERRWLDRLREDGVEGRVAALAHRDRRDEDDRRLDGLLRRANGIGERQPVHVRHQQVGQDHVEVLAPADPVEGLAR